MTECKQKKDECVTHVTFLSVFVIVFIPTRTGRTLTGVLFTSGKTDYDKKNYFPLTNRVRGLH